MQIYKNVLLTAVKLDPDIHQHKECVPDPYQIIPGSATLIWNVGTFHVIVHLNLPVGAHNLKVVVFSEFLIAIVLFVKKCVDNQKECASKYGSCT